MNQDNSQLVDYEELVAKAVRAEAKAPSLRPSFYMRETDLSCLQGYWPAYTIAYKIQIWKAIKNYHGDDSKASKGSASTPTSTSTQDFKPSNKAKKDKKKKYYQGKRDSRELKDSTTPASGVNVAEVGGKGRRKNKKDVSEIMCFNYNKKGYYLSKCPKPPKN